jgi:hypothetical protein
MEEAEENENVTLQNCDRQAQNNINIHKKGSLGIVVV